MKLKSLVIAAMGLFISTTTFSQETEKVDTLDQLHQRVTQVEDDLVPMKKLKISGYFQPQWQSSQIDVNGGTTRDMKVGSAKNASDGTSDFNRYGIRRGRLKATYEDQGCVGVAELEITDAKVQVKNLNGSALDPWIGFVTLKAGVFDRPFGYELSYSSSKLESPERSRVVGTLFPDESDLGSQLTFQAPKSSPWNALKLEAGLFAGNGISVDTKSKKDFIAHLTYVNSIGNFKYGLGVSAYEGVIFQPTKKVYTMSGSTFAVDSTASNLNGYAKREYFGADAQLSYSSVLGLSSIRAEYIMGTQPGSPSSGNSPNATTVVTADTYIRSIAGGYVIFVQDIADTKHSIVLKYDFLDPNTKISGNSIGVAKSGTSKADLAYSTIGLGYAYRMNNNVKLSVYYDMVTNETTSTLVQTYNADKSIKGTDFTGVLAANLLTVRLQYKF